MEVEMDEGKMGNDLIVELIWLLTVQVYAEQLELLPLLKLTELWNYS